MPRWQAISDKILTHQITQFLWRQTKRLGIASESPRTFGIVAALGIAGLVWLNIQPRVPAPLSEPVIEAAHLDETPAADEPVAPYSPPEESYTLKRGETLITLLRRATIDRANAHAVVNRLKNVTNLRRMQAGQEIRLKRQAQDGRRVAEIRVRDSFHEEAVLLMDEGKYKVERQTIETHELTHLVTGEITDSLYLSAERAGLPKKVIIDLIRMLSFDVDFEREIRTGDRFTVYFARDFSPQFGDIENGRIIHAQLTLRRRTLDAFYFKDARGQEGYYDLSGESTKRALMKTPLDVAVLTSSFGKRKHPVLGYTRMHKGSDFRAPTGTPIMAAGDGVIEMAARNGSYGNYIRIRHNSTYKTAYAHLSRYGKGIRKGKRVKQGQIIGYAGATGRVTGPHLHYEVFVDGKQVNPMRLKLPTGRTLAGADLTAFQGMRGHIKAEIEAINRSNDTLLVDSEAGTPQLSEAR